MKILIVSSYNKGATLNRVLGYINSLVENHEIECILPEDGSKSGFPSGNTTYHFIPFSTVSSRNFVLRYWQEFKFGLKCLKLQKKISADVEIVTVPFIALIITTMLRKRASIKILDVRDLVWEYLQGGAFLQFLKFIMRKLHVYYLNKYDYVIATNEHEIEWLKDNTSVKNPILINNGILQEQFTNIANLKPKTAEGTLQILYTGNVGIAQNLSSFIKAVQHNSNVIFTVVGDGNDFENIKGLVAAQDIKNVCLTGRVDQARIFDFYEKADVLYAKLDENFSTAVPSKLYEYLATNKPIIYSGKGAAVDFLKNFENIYICKDDVDSVQDTISLLVKNGAASGTKNQSIIKQHYIRETIVSREFTKIINR